MPKARKRLAGAVRPRKANSQSAQPRRGESDAAQPERLCHPGYLSSEEGSESRGSIPEFVLSDVAERQALYKQRLAKNTPWQNWQETASTGKNRQVLARTGKYWQEPASIGKKRQVVRPLDPSTSSGQASSGQTGSRQAAARTGNNGKREAGTGNQEPVAGKGEQEIGGWRPTAARTDVLVCGRSRSRMISYKGGRTGRPERDG